MWKLDELLRFLEAGGRLPGKPWYQVVAAPGTQLNNGFYPDIRDRD
jgi:hypothetical protein